VAPEPGRHRAVERVDAPLHAGDQVVDLADPKQVSRPLRRQPLQLRRRPGDDLVHLRLVAPERPPDGDPAGVAGGDRGRRFPAQVGLHPALHDPVDELRGRSVVGMPAQAALKPPVRALGGARRVLPGHVEGGALVEGQRDVRSEGRLDLHRGLGAHQVLGAVAVGAKAHPVLPDREDRTARGDAPAAAALDLVGDVAVTHGEDLKAPGVGDDRPRPAHQLVQAPKALY